MIPLHKCCADRGVPFGAQGHCIGFSTGMEEPGEYLVNYPCFGALSNQKVYDAIKECWLEHENIDIRPCIKKDQGTVSD